MKKIASLVLLMMCVMAANVYSQGFNYQTVLRSSTGSVEDGVAVTLTFTIHQTTATGTSVYSESHAVTTNEFGIISVVIGEGTPVSGGFADIDWSDGPYFMNVDIDGEDMGTAQLNSVPYANYANKTSEALNADSARVAAKAYMAANSDTANVAKELLVANAAAGDVMYFDGLSWVRLAKGAEGQVLTIESDKPVWKNVSVATNAEPKIGEAFSGGIIVATYPDGNVLVAYNSLILVGDNPIFDYATAESAVSALGTGWRIPTRKEILKVMSNSYVLSVIPEGNHSGYWISTVPDGGGYFVYLDANYFNAEDAFIAHRVIAVKKVIYE